MRHALSLRLLITMLVCLIPIYRSEAATSPSPAPALSAPQISAILMRLPLQFEANQGQVDEPVKFLARGKGYNLFLTPSESVLVLTGREASSVKREAESDPTDVIDHASKEYKRSVVRMQLEGANPSPTVSGAEKLPGIVNYFIGNDPKKWRTNIPTYAKVQYQEVYPGIDLAYYGNQGKLEYDFIVAPGADPDQIKLAFEGASEIKVAESGDLLLATDLGDVLVQKPIVYQLEPDGHKTLVAGNYIVERLSVLSSQFPVLSTQHSPLPRVSIRLAAYDRTKPLVIDPVLLYSTYLGGSGSDEGRSIAVDGNGQTYVTGFTQSGNFPTLNASQPAFGGGRDVFVTKLTATGALAYSTYLGGSSSDEGRGIAVDGSGQASVTGRTNSTNFPTLNASQPASGGFSDAFVTKLTATGALAYSTYLGGSGVDEGFGIAVDGSGQASVTGRTDSGNFPTLNASQPASGGFGDVFVTKLTATGALVYSTYLGGSSNDEGRGIAVDGSGQASVTGWTNSTNFPTLNASQPASGGFSDAFVTKLTAMGALAYSTYLGGSGFDEGNGIAVDGSGQASVTGRTNSGNFPTLNATQPAFDGGFDAFVTALTATGALAYSTYLGGSGSDEGRSIAVDGSGQAYVTGFTESTNFPTLNASQPAFGGGFDAFVTALTATGALAYSTYLGGSGSDEGRSIAVDGSGQAYVAGFTESTNFPTLNASQPASGGSRDAFVTKLSASVPNQPPVCSAAQANPAVLWSPNHQFVPIAIKGVTDPDEDSVTITVTGVTQDEPVNGKGDGNTSPDAVIEAGAASVRAERAGSGNGRVYRIAFKADDGNGGTCTGAVTVGVPHSQKKGLTAIDDGQIYNSTLP